MFITILAAIGAAALIYVIVAVLAVIVIDHSDLGPDALGLVPVVAFGSLVPAVAAAVAIVVSR